MLFSFLASICISSSCGILGVRARAQSQKKKKKICLETLHMELPPNVNIVETINPKVFARKFIYNKSNGKTSKYAAENVWGKL